MLSWLTGRKTHKPAAERLYGAIVAQSRLPAFYAEWGVPDTVTGRFEMIVLHMFLTLDRLQTAEAGEDGKADEDRKGGEQLGQSLNEAFMADLDDAMREMGVADVRVSKRMHQAAGAFFGRLMAYRDAAAQPVAGESDPLADPLAQAIARNVLAEADAPDAAPVPQGSAAASAALAAYCRAAARHLSEIPLAALSAGQITFPPPERAPADAAGRAPVRDAKP